MRGLGALLRALLNINTIWGVMILGAFAVAVLQHYLPTTTTFQAGALRDGDNAVTIAVVGRDGQERVHTYNLQVESGQPVIAAADRGPGSDRPWLIDARASGAGHLLTWDAHTYGRYTLTANGQVVRHGSLVTLQSLTDAAFDWAKVGFELALGLVASMVLFLGLMKVGEKAGIVQLVARLVHPLIRFLFPEIPKDHPAAGAIVMNVTSTMLGLGNAATPFGLKAMQHMQSLNPHPLVATNAQVMLLAINTAGLALIPTTLLAVRQSEGCSNPFEVIGTCMVAGATATVVAIVMAKLLCRLPLFSTRAALFEDQTEPADGTSANAAGQERA